jgi:glycosyltransferase involved in cell wall biosynthesis
VYCHFPFEAEPVTTARASESWATRPAIERWVRRALYRRSWRRRMRGYQRVLANSRFTAGWIEQLWGRRADVVYPPVAAAPPAAEKRDVIVTLGRFIQTDRKGAATQLDAFARAQPGLPPGWRLQMLGFCADVPGDRAYLDRLRAQAAQLPVMFVVNAPRAEILHELAAAKVFWHTMGLDDLDAIPPYHREHFGIATVEAMRAGCVPIVPASGGQPEVVEHGVNGFLCRNVDDVVRHTLALAQDDGRRRALSEAAVWQSRRFGPEAFEKAFAASVGAALDPAAGPT